MCDQCKPKRLTANQQNFLRAGLNRILDEFIADVEIEAEALETDDPVESGIVASPDQYEQNDRARNIIRSREPDPDPREAWQRKRSLDLATDDPIAPVRFKATDFVDGPDGSFGPTGYPPKTSEFWKGQRPIREQVPDIKSDLKNAASPTIAEQNARFATPNPHGDRVAQFLRAGLSHIRETPTSTLRAASAPKVKAQTIDEQNALIRAARQSTVKFKE